MIPYFIANLYFLCIWKAWQLCQCINLYVIVYNFHSSSQWVIGMHVSIIRSWLATDIFHLFGSPLFTLIPMICIKAATTKLLYWQDIYLGMKSLTHYNYVTNLVHELSIDIGSHQPAFDLFTPHRKVCHMIIISQWCN